MLPHTRLHLVDHVDPRGRRDNADDGAGQGRDDDETEEADEDTFAHGRHLDDGRVTVMCAPTIQRSGAWSKRGRAVFPARPRRLCGGETPGCDSGAGGGEAGSKASFALSKSPPGPPFGRSGRAMRPRPAGAATHSIGSRDDGGGDTQHRE